VPVVHPVAQVHPVQLEDQEIQEQPEEKDPKAHPAHQDLQEPAVMLDQP